MLTSSRAVSPATIDRAVLAIRVASFQARVTAPPEVLGALRALFADSAESATDAPEGCPPHLAIEVRREGPGTETYGVAAAGRVCWAGLRLDELIPRLEWALLDGATACLGRRHLLFHAGAVAHAGRGIIFPASSGSGKTTLTAALVAEGFALCSDEIAMIDLETARLRPFARSLRLRAASRAILAARYPRFTAAAVRRAWDADAPWHLRPPDAAWSAAPVPTRLIIFPRYLRGARASLTPLTRAQALPPLLQHALNARQLGRGGMARAVDLVQRADAFALTIGDDLPAVVALVRGACG